MSFLDRIKGKTRAAAGPDSVPPVPFDELSLPQNLSLIHI